MRGNLKLPGPVTSMRSSDEGSDDGLGALLAANGLSAFAHIFAAEQITLKSAARLSESHLKELGIPMGPPLKALKLGLLGVTCGLHWLHGVTWGYMWVAWGYTWVSWGYMWVALGYTRVTWGYMWVAWGCMWGVTWAAIDVHVGGYMGRNRNLSMSTDVQPRHATSYMQPM